MTPTVLSLFSGIGGLDLGLQRAGWQVVGQVENDPYCQRVLQKHWPKVPRWGDIREVDPDDLPRADLICGGFPCQPVSSAGKRLGQDDERWLWPEAARLVRGLRPRWVLLENVPGLLARGMGDVLGELAACGYDAEWDCIPAAAVGAPHLRERIFVVAYPAGDRRGQRVAGERERQHDPVGWGEQPLGNGQDGAMADPDDQGRHRGEEFPPGRDALQRASQLRADADRRGAALAHADGQAGRQAARPTISGPGAASLPPGSAEPGRRGSHLADPDRQPLVWTAKPWGERPPWPAEPPIRRVADGIPAWVVRPQLRGLGNAVVPQVAELIGRRILAAHRAELLATDEGRERP